MLPLFAKRPATRTTAATTKKRLHVAVCPFLHPLHRPETFFLLCRRIAEAHRDVQVSLFTNVGNAMYLYNYWDPEVDENLHFLAVGEWPSSSATLEELLRVYLEEVEVDLRKSMAMAEEYFGKITYVVADAFIADVCRGIAEEKGVGWSAVWTASAASVAAYIHGDEILRKINEANPPGLPRRLHSPVDVDHYLPGFPPGVHTGELPQGALGAPEPLGKLFHDMVCALPKADSVIVDSFGHLESSTASALLTPKFLLGGLFSINCPFPSNIDLEDREGMLPWLDARAAPASVVYINLGNQFIPPETEFHALAEALEATGVAFLWYVAPTWPRVKLPEGFVERTSKSGQGKVVTTSVGLVRFRKLEREVLRHKAVGAQMLGQTSWWSVSETISAGKPLICKPQTHLFDQALNAALVDRTWGIGVGLENYTLTKETAERALKRVMVDEEGRKIKEKVAALKKLAEEDAAGANASDEFISFITK